MVVIVLVLDQITAAEKEGFEPPDLLQSTVFKTAAFDRSAISPIRVFVLLKPIPGILST